MFYQDEPDNIFRFGDIIRGFASLTPIIDEPILNLSDCSCNINFSIPNYCVILSPCCSISDKVLTMAPLIQIRNSFFKNPYFAEDLTRINMKIPPEKTMPPESWDKLPVEQKQDRLNKGIGYTFLELFIYKKHYILPEYTVHSKKNNVKTNYYMIDFRNTFHVNCNKITSPQNVPIESKCLQLSIDARTNLREKIAFYYSRVPQEDILYV